MCSYCGCESITVIGRFMAEHADIVTECGAVRRAVQAGDRALAAEHAGRLATMLHEHTTAEEVGLFAEMRLDPVFTDHVDALCSEHRDIGAGLRRVVEGDLSVLDAFEELLRRHIDREDNGLFPAAAVALDGPAWERVVDRTPGSPSGVSPEN